MNVISLHFLTKAGKYVNKTSHHVTCYITGGHIRRGFLLVVWTVTVLICGDNFVCMRSRRPRPDPFTLIPKTLIGDRN